MQVQRWDMPMNAAPEGERQEPGAVATSHVVGRKCPTTTAFLGGDLADVVEMTLNHAPAGARSYRFFDSGLLWSFACRSASMVSSTRFDEYTTSKRRKQPNRIQN